MKAIIIASSAIFNSLKEFIENLSKERSMQQVMEDGQKPPSELQLSLIKTSIPHGFFNAKKQDLHKIKNEITAREEITKIESSIKPNVIEPRPPGR